MIAVNSQKAYTPILTIDCTHPTHGKGGALSGASGQAQPANNPTVWSPLVMTIIVGVPMVSTYT